MYLISVLTYLLNCECSAGAGGRDDTERRARVLDSRAAAGADQGGDDASRARSVEVKGQAAARLYRRRRRRDRRQSSPTGELLPST